MNLLPDCAFVAAGNNHLLEIVVELGESTAVQANCWTSLVLFSLETKLINGERKGFGSLTATSTRVHAVWNTDSAGTDQRYLDGSVGIAKEKAAGDGFEEHVY